MSEEEQTESMVLVNQTTDGRWRVEQFNLPYPKDAPLLTKEIYKEVDNLISNHMKGLLGKVLTQLDSYGDNPAVNKARKDLMKEAIHKQIENLNIDIAYTCEKLDAWVRWFRSNYVISQNPNQQSSVPDKDFNPFSKVPNLD